MRGRRITALMRGWRVTTLMRRRRITAWRRWRRIAAGRRRRVVPAGRRGGVVSHENLPVIGLEWHRNLGKDLVDERLSLRIPQGEQNGDEPKDAEAEPGGYPVAALARERHPDSNWLPGLFVDVVELHVRLADARACGPLPIAEIPD